MNGLQTFENVQFGSVRTMEEDGRILFCATDVATSLGYSNPQKAVRDHCRVDGCTFCSVTDKLGRQQSVKFIDEGNLYRLIVHSKLPSAEKFERWVFDEVLPSIRQNGQYAVEPSQVIFPTPYDYMKAAKIVAGCPSNRLGIVITLLERAGLKVQQSRILYDRDTNTENIYMHILDFIGQNKEHFGGQPGYEVWGYVRKDVVLISKDVLNTILNEVGTEFDDVKDKMWKYSYILTDSRGRYSHWTKCHGVKTQYVKLRIEEVK